MSIFLHWATAQLLSASGRAKARGKNSGLPSSARPRKLATAAQSHSCSTGKHHGKMEKNERRLRCGSQQISLEKLEVDCWRYEASASPWTCSWCSSGEWKKTRNMEVTRSPLCTATATENPAELGVSLSKFSTAEATAASPWCLKSINPWCIDVSHHFQHHLQHLPASSWEWFIKNPEIPVCWWDEHLHLFRAQEHQLT